MELKNHFAHVSQHGSFFFFLFPGHFFLKRKYIAQREDLACFKYLCFLYFEWFLSRLKLYFPHFILCDK